MLGSYGIFLADDEFTALLRKYDINIAMMNPPLYWPHTHHVLY